MKMNITIRWRRILLIIKMESGLLREKKMALRAAVRVLLFRRLRWGRGWVTTNSETLIIY